MCDNREAVIAGQFIRTAGSRARRALGTALAFGCWFVTTPANAQPTAADATRLEWIRLEGAEGCPARNLFEQAVRTRMAGNPFSAVGRRTLTIELSRESGPYRAVLILKNEGSAGVDSRQELFSYSTECDELFGATVLSVALLLSPREDDDANSLELDDDVSEDSEPVAQAEGASELPGPSKPRPKIELSPPQSEEDPVVPIPIAPRPWARKQSRAVLSAIISFEQLPDTAVGMALRAEFPVSPQWLLAIEGAWVGTQFTAAEGNGRLGVGLSLAWVDAVWIIYRVDPLEVLLDGGLGLNVLHVHARGFTGPGGDSVRAAARVGLGLNLQVDAHVALCSAFSAQGIVNPASFGSPGQPRWKQTWLAGQLHFGLAIDFP
jgi:hypothetical protein